MQKNILITGVSTGIGRALAEHLLEEGHQVWGSVRMKTDAQDLEEKGGARFHTLVFDVTDDAAIDAAAEAMIDTPIHVLINNAGFALNGPLEYMDIQKFRKQIDVNLTGLLKVTQAFLPQLKLGQAQQQSTIINMGSISGILATPFVGPYVASKHALEGLNDSLRRELLVYGIQVVLLQPGPVRTPIWEKAIERPQAFPDTAYAPILKNAQARIQRNMERALPVSAVTTVVDRVIRSSRPRLRYVIDRQPWKIRLYRWLPARFIDGKVLKYFKYKYKEAGVPWRQ